MKSIKGFITNPIVLVICGIIFGFLFAEQILFFDGGINVELCQKMGILDVFTKVPVFLTWITLFIVFTSSSTAIGIISIKNIIEVSRQYSLSRKNIAAIYVLIMTAGTGVFLYILRLKHFEPANRWPASPLKNQDVKLFILFAYNTSMSALGVVGMIIIGMAALCETAKQITANAVTNYFKLIKQLNNLLLMSGFVLSSGVIIIYLFYKVVAALGAKEGVTFNSEPAILFGLLFTLFIAGSYIPVKFLLNEFGRSIKRSYIGEAPLKLDPDLKIWFDNKIAMEKYLALEVSATSTTLQLMPILAPILASVIPHLFSHFSK